MNSDYFFSLRRGNMQLLDRFCMEIDYNYTKLS